MTLDGPRWGKPAGEAKHLVVLCHGVGADGNDLIDLAPYWSKAAPDAAFISPHGPEPFAMAPHGRQWFDIGDRDPVHIAAGVRRAQIALDGLIDAELARLGLPADAYALMGFSQGAMTVLFTGLRRAVPPRAILAFSGALIDPDSLARDLVGRPPVLLVHGIEDQVVPVSRSHDAEAALRANMVPVQALYVPKLAHGIDDSGLSAGALALQKGFAAPVEI
jgi:phospholipase/carboxylesterase